MAMALTASALYPFGFRINQLKGQACQFHGYLSIHTPNPSISAKLSVKLPTVAQFHELPKVKVHLNNVKERLWELTPDSVKDLEWKKAESTALQGLVSLGQRVFQWSLIWLFIVSSVSDVAYSILRNKELVIPFGLFVGCMMADYINEIVNELFPSLRDRGLEWKLYGLGCFFVLVKILSACFGVGGQVFLLHAGNGGLMQLFWLRKQSLEEHDRGSIDDPLLKDEPEALNASS